MDQPFDWKKSGVYSWKAAFPTMPAGRRRREVPALPAPAKPPAEIEAAQPAKALPAKPAWDPGAPSGPV